MLGYHQHVSLLSCDKTGIKWAQSYRSLSSISSLNKTRWKIRKYCWNKKNDLASAPDHVFPAVLFLKTSCFLQSIIVPVRILLHNLIQSFQLGTNKAAPNKSSTRDKRLIKPLAQTCFVRWGLMFSETTTKSRMKSEYFTISQLCIHLNSYYIFY